jgi:hypothetical protein
MTKRATRRSSSVFEHAEIPATRLKRRKTMEVHDVAPPEDASNVGKKSEEEENDSAVSNNSSKPQAREEVAEKEVDELLTPPESVIDGEANEVPSSPAKKRPEMTEVVATSHVARKMPLDAREEVENGPEKATSGTTGSVEVPVATKEVSWKLNHGK